MGLQNYRDLLSDPRMWSYFRITGFYVVASVLLETLVGFGLALLLRRKFFGSGLLTTLILVPMMLSPVVVGLFWKLIYNPTYGIFNYLLGFPIGRGFTRIRDIIHEHKSCSATMWHPHPQNHRPRINVERIASVKKMNPVLISPSRTVWMLSLGSTGDTVAPVTSQWMMCAAISTCTVINTAARHFPALECLIFG